jgi:hypothetical protein
MFISEIPQPAVSPRKHENRIFIGFAQAALTFLNRPAVFTDMAPA